MKPDDLERVLVSNVNDDLTEQVHQSLSSIIEIASNFVFERLSSALQNTLSEEPPAYTATQRPNATLKERSELPTGYHELSKTSILKGMPRPSVKQMPQGEQNGDKDQLPPPKPPKKPRSQSASSGNQAGRSSTSSNRHSITSTEDNVVETLNIDPSTVLHHPTRNRVSLMAGTRRLPHDIADKIEKMKEQQQRQQHE